MTDQPQTEQQPPLVVDLSTAPAEDRLATLYAAYPEVKAKADAAAAALKAVTDGIKVELTARAPGGTPRLEVHGSNGTPLALRWQVTNRFDSKRFQREQPAVYDSYKRPSGAWVLAPIKGGE